MQVYVPSLAKVTLMMISIDSTELFPVSELKVSNIIPSGPDHSTVGSGTPNTSQESMRVSDSFTVVLCGSMTKAAGANTREEEKM